MTELKKYKKAEQIMSKCQVIPEAFPFYSIHPAHLNWYIDTIKALEERVKELEEYEWMYKELGK